jgi:hypothetical protein
MQSPKIIIYGDWKIIKSTSGLVSLFAGFRDQTPFFEKFFVRHFISRGFPTIYGQPCGSKDLLRASGESVEESMAQPNPPRPVARETQILEGRNEAHSSGVTWPAIIAGAFVAAALSLILLTLGTGLGLSSVSPWSNVGASASAIGAGAVLWLIVTQIAASSMGGYLAGRLRVKWASVHTDEVYFRDTAHGFLVWAVGMVITAGFLASAAASLAGSTPRAPANQTSQRADLNPNEYFVDTLLRPNGTATTRADVSERGEVSRTFDHDLSLGEIPAEDKTYLTQVVSLRAGTSPAEADKRVTSAFSAAQEAADKTRKALAHLSLWLFVALLSGAFSASYAGTIGGRQRDRALVL